MKDEASRIKNQECRPLPSSNVLTWIAARMHQWRMTVLGLRTYVKRLCLHVSPTCTWANMVLCVHGVVSIHLAFPKPLDYCNRKSITDDGSLHQKVKLHIWTERLWYGEMAFMQRRAPEKHRYLSGWNPLNFHGVTAMIQSGARHGVQASSIKQQASIRYQAILSIIRPSIIPIINYSNH